jgi:site-specific recombinase XerD
MHRCQSSNSRHTWRHSIATQLLDAGAPLHKVSSFLGHSDSKITVKAYYSESEGLKNVYNDRQSKRLWLTINTAKLPFNIRLNTGSRAIN